MKCGFSLQNKVETNRFYLFSSDFQGAAMLEWIRTEKSECEKVSLSNTRYKTWDPTIGSLGKKKEFGVRSWR